MKLDLRSPTFVFLGAWNRAIFQPGWIARFLFAIPQGESTRATQVATIGPGQAPIMYIRNVGVSATNDRVVLYANEFDERTISLIEQVAARLFATLPHTPFGAFGVNFRFIENQPEPRLYDLLKTRDRLEEQFKVLRRSIDAAIEIEADITLNLSRQPSEDGILFDLNFNYASISADGAAGVLGGIISKYYQKSKEILGTLYGVEHEGFINLPLDTAVEQSNEQIKEAQ